MLQKSLTARDAEQQVQQTAVTDIDLGRLDLALGEVGVPRLELADHECVAEQVQVASCGRFSHAQRCRSRSEPEPTVGTHRAATGRAPPARPIRR